ncbi:hypothetical protein QBC45DRAFT_420692 [Copromyces sp. CBS 386.78]|nr:hypothetical protein QBC45DRAFT_420692 [Copromyces sp. CBS 386.78]
MSPSHGFGCLRSGIPITHISFDDTNRCLRTNVGRIKIVTETTESQVVLDNLESYNYSLG